MTILALEFSSQRRSVAALTRDADGLERIGRACEAVGRATPAFSLIERALAGAGVTREAVDRIAVGLGPGSYTGIRAAIAIAQGWQLARGVALVGVESVRCLAVQLYAAGERGRRHLVVDAQRREFYCATYELAADGPQEVEPLRIVPAVEVEACLGRGEAVLGPDVAAACRGARDAWPDAITAARISRNSDAVLPGERLAPVYLREVSFLKAQPARGSDRLFRH